MPHLNLISVTVGQSLVLWFNPLSVFSIFSHNDPAFSRVSLDQFYQTYLLIFSTIKTKIYMMYKDLNHLNLTIADKLLGVGSHFSSAIHVWARPVDRDILLTQAVSSQC